MPLFEDILYPGRKKKRLQQQQELNKPATKNDIDRLRVELKETPEEKEELAIYNKWISLSKEQQKEKWKYLSIKQRNKLAQIINERMSAK